MRACTCTPVAAMSVAVAEGGMAAAARWESLTPVHWRCSFRKVSSWGDASRRALGRGAGRSYGTYFEI